MIRERSSAVKPNLNHNNMLGRLLAEGRNATNGLNPKQCAQWPGTNDALCVKEQFFRGTGAGGGMVKGRSVRVRSCGGAASDHVDGGELKLVDNWRFLRRMPRRGSAIRDAQARLGVGRVEGSGVEGTLSKRFWVW